MSESEKSETSSVGGGGPRVRPRLACVDCGHEHFFEADEAGFDSADTIPWGHCKTCACKTPNYNCRLLAAQLADLRGELQFEREQRDAARMEVKSLRAERDTVQQHLNERQVMTSAPNGLFVSTLSTTNGNAAGGGVTHPPDNTSPDYPAYKREKALRCKADADLAALRSRGQALVHQWRNFATTERAEWGLCANQLGELLGEEKNLTRVGSP